MGDDDREIRIGRAFELRDSDETARVEGHAAVFNQDADIGGWFTERIRPGAFAAAIDRDDVPFLINHDGLPLARRSAGRGTLELREDDVGLWIGTDLDVTDPDVASIVPKMRRGDLDKMSFAFVAKREEWDETGEIPIRTILEASLYDVSIVTTPAYAGTDIGLRAFEARAADRNSQITRRRAERNRMIRRLGLSDLRSRGLIKKP